MRYQVTSYGSGLWCIVDSTKFIDDEARRANWPMQLQWHERTGWIPACADKREAQRVAELLNQP